MGARYANGCGDKRDGCAATRTVLAKTLIPRTCYLKNVHSFPLTHIQLLSLSSRAIFIVFVIGFSYLETRLDRRYGACRILCSPHILQLLSLLRGDVTRTRNCRCPERQRTHLAELETCQPQSAYATHFLTLILAAAHRSHAQAEPHGEL